MEINSDSVEKSNYNSLAMFDLRPIIHIEEVGSAILIVIIMGVSGSGKTEIGSRLAQRLDWSFEDADDYHSSENKQKMHNGIPLTESDREPWLGALSELIAERLANGTDTVLACSALRDSYRDHLNKPGVYFLYLKADFETIATRLKGRKHEFMSNSLLASQFKTLEEPEDALIVDASRSIEKVLDDAEKQVLGLLEKHPS